MNAPWLDPYRRELLIAAAAGAVWALLGVALTARGAGLDPPPLQGGARGGTADLYLTLGVDPRGDATVGNPSAVPSLQGKGAGSCRIHNYLSDGSANVGSGTLVDVTADRSRGLVLTCAHLFTEGRGRVVVEFPGGQTHGANVIAVDAEADLAALEIASPQGSAAPMGLDVDPSGPLTACGFGPNGQFRCVAGSVIGAAEGPGQVSVRIAGAVRSGDSGGGAFDARGRLVGVVWGESGGVTYASTGGPLRRFLERVLGRRSPANPTTPLTTPAICPDGLCPLVRPNPLDATPTGREPAASGNCDCGDEFATIAARIAALEAGKQDRGDYLSSGALAAYARTDELAQFDSQSRERHKSLLERIERVGTLVGVAGRVAAPLALPALGISGPAGWGVLAATAIGSALVGRWRRRKARVTRREAREENPKKLAPRASQLAPSPEATAAADGSFRLAFHTAETQQPVERDDREARELLRLSQLEGRDPLQDALAGRLALDRLDATADGDADPQRARWADDLRRELRERFNDIAPTKMQINGE